MIKNCKIIIGIASLFLLLASCSEEWFDTSPTTAVSSTSAFNTVDDIKSVLNGAYDKMQHGYFYGGLLTWYGDVRGEDMKPTDVSARTSTEYRFLSTTETSNVDYIWTRVYSALLSVNSILENIDIISTTTEEEEELLIGYEGQALALRALYHFELTRIFGMPYKKDNGASLGVPIVTRVLNPDEDLARNTVAECYAQIISDLEAAIELLPETKTNGEINKYGAEALLARVYLYKGDNDLALQLAEEVINSTSYSLIEKDNYVSSWGTGFSSESIIEIVQNTDDNDGGHESIGYLLSPAGYGAITLTSSYVNLVKEVSEDVRIDLLSPFNTQEDIYLLKYPGKDGAEVAVNNNIIIRLSEVYLIAAEAAYKANNTTKARTYINDLVEKRTGIADYYDLSEITYERIFNERRKELVCEGHRFYDAIRDGNTLNRNYDEFFGEVAQISWDDYRVIMPIPRAELDVNSNMAQNDGYQD